MGAPSGAGAPTGASALSRAGASAGAGAPSGAGKSVAEGVPITDGRRLKGERRRRALIEATLRVVERDGASGVTHRTVAREAGLPSTASTYYFESIDALLNEALATSTNEDADRIVALAEGPDDNRHRALAALMAECVADRGRLHAEFELCLRAARRPELRGPNRRWAEALRTFARRLTDDPLRVDLFAHAYDGLLLQGLLADEPPTADAYEKMLRQLLP
ncbi:TetR/AcrR family transcriptional regulator [Streptomyces sp. NPDC088745]|uniref:TetR/AcrR family transcriptional regulator n=1 Tax=Streptomyces sp. NPDC088745 TaxID=3365884 RepID=UPI003820DF0B